MTMYCRNCGVLKTVGHKNKEEEKCRKAIGRKYGFLAPEMPMKSLWVIE